MGIVISLIQMIYSCLMWRTIKVWEDMHISTRSMPNMADNCEYLGLQIHLDTFCDKHDDE